MEANLKGYLVLGYCTSNKEPYRRRFVCIKDEHGKAILNVLITKEQISKFLDGENIIDVKYGLGDYEYPKG